MCAWASNLISLCLYVVVNQLTPCGIVVNEPPNIPGDAWTCNVCLKLLYGNVVNKLAHHENSDLSLQSNNKMIGNGDTCWMETNKDYE